AATSIGPQSARVVFADVTLLQQLAPHAVPHDHRKSAVEGAGVVRFELAGGADDMVASIDEDQQLFLVAHDRPSCEDTRRVVGLWPRGEKHDFRRLFATLGARTLHWARRRSYMPIRSRPCQSFPYAQVPS